MLLEIIRFREKNYKNVKEWESFNLVWYENQRYILFEMNFNKKQMIRINVKIYFLIILSHIVNLYFLRYYIYMCRLHESTRYIVLEDTIISIN